MPTEITLMQVFSQRKQPMGASSHRREKEKNMTRRHKISISLIHAVTVLPVGADTLQICANLKMVVQQ